MSTIKIQPKQLADLTLPYPYFVDSETGAVQRQDFWQGEPAGLLGFQKTADEQRVALHMKDWAENPQKAVGMFPVFVRAEGGIYSLSMPVESVEVQR